jgi:hypothetical protein
MLRASSDDLVKGVSATRPLTLPEGGGQDRVLVVVLGFGCVGRRCD